MALEAQIQEQYNKATEIYGQIRGILDAQGKEALPQEKQNEVDALFEQFDAFNGTAKRLEGALKREREMAAINAPANGLEAPKSMPATPGSDGPNPEEVAAYMKAWNRAMKVGTRGLTGSELKALRADEDEAGGYLVAPKQVVTALLKFVDDQVFIRKLATVYQLDKAESLGILSLDSDLNDATWTSELGTGDEDTAKPFGGRELKPSPLAKRIKVSRKLLRQSTVDVNALIRERMGVKFGYAQERGYLTGTGVNQPLGVYTVSSNGIDTDRDTAAANAASFVGDDFINTKFGLKQAYWDNARWLLHRTVLKSVRKLKDSQNNYIWAPGLGPGGGLTGGLPPTLVDSPYDVSEMAPSTVSTGQYTAIIGDWKRGYAIAEAMTLEIQVLNELYAETNQVGYIGRLEVDGMPVLAEAFSRLKMA